MPQNNDTQTCSKCKGRGYLPHFATQNDPGTCRKCKGKGELKYTSVEAHNNMTRAIVDMELSRIEEEAQKIKENFESSRRTSPAVLEKRLTPLRARWASVKSGDAHRQYREVKRGYWS